MHRRCAAIATALLAAACAAPEGGAAAELAAAACALDAAALTRACTDDSVPLITGARGAAEVPRIAPSISYGLHLRAEGDRNAGAIRFEAITSGEHVVYLGTPNVPFAVTGPGGPLVTSCSTRLYADACSRMRRALGVTLAAGEEYRLELGPITPQRWVRLRVEPPAPRPIAFAAALDGTSVDLFTVDPANGAPAAPPQTAVPPVIAHRGRRTPPALLIGGDGDQTLPRWSPDGAHVAYVVGGTLRMATRAGDDDHLVAARVGRGLAGRRPTVTAAAWSPDGERLIYPFPREPYIVDTGDERVDQSYETGLHIVGVDGGGDVAYAEPFVRRSPPGMGTLYEPAWSSRGLIAYLADDDCPDCAGGGIVASSRDDGSSYRRLMVDRGAADVHAIDFSPDGDEVVFERDAGPVAPQLTRARLVPSSDPTVTLLVTRDLGVRGKNPVWSPDGRAIAFVGSDGIYVMGADGEAPRRIVAVDDVRGIDW